MKSVPTKKGTYDNNFFSPLSFVPLFGSGMGKNQDPGSGINNKHPGSATLHFPVFPLQIQREGGPEGGDPEPGAGADKEQGLRARAQAGEADYADQRACQE